MAGPRFLVSRGMGRSGVPAGLVLRGGRSRGRKSIRRRCGSGDRGEAGLRPDQAMERPRARARRTASLRRNVAGFGWRRQDLSAGEARDRGRGVEKGGPATAARVGRSTIFRPAFRFGPVRQLQRADGDRGVHTAPEQSTWRHSTPIHALFDDRTARRSACPGARGHTRLSGRCNGNALDAGRVRQRCNSDHGGRSDGDRADHSKRHLPTFGRHAYPGERERAW